MVERRTAGQSTYPEDGFRMLVAFFSASGTYYASTDDGHSLQLNPKQAAYSRANFGGGVRPGASADGSQRSLLKTLCMLI